MKTIEELLQTKVTTKNGIEFTPDFRVSVQSKKDNGIHIMVHPFGHDGDTLDFIVKGNEITPCRSMI